MSKKEMLIIAVAVSLFTSPLLGIAAWYIMKHISKN